MEPLEVYRPQSKWAQIRPRRSKCTTHRERWHLIILGLGAIYEGLVMVLSLGYLATDIRGWILFDLFEDD